MKKIWRKALSGFLATLLLLTTLAIPAAATGVAVTTSDMVATGTVDTDDSILPIVLHLSNHNSGPSGATGDDLDIQVDDADGLLGLSWNTSTSVVVNYNEANQLLIVEVPISNPNIENEIGNTFDVDVTVTSIGSTSPLFGGSTFGPITLTYEVVAATPNELQNGLIDDVDLDNNYAPGENVHVEVTLDNANQDYNDVTVEGWIEDASGDRIGDKEESKEFNLDANDDEETVDFDFKLPNDVDEGTYTLNLVVISDEGQLDLDSSYDFDVDREQHSLFYDDVSFDSTVKAGDSLDVAVTLFNNGLEDEDDVRAQVIVSGVGISQTSDYFTVEEDDDATRYFTLTLPSSMSQGTYEVTVHSWNNEVDVSEVRELFVDLAAPTMANMSGVSTTADNPVKAMESVTGGAYILTVANNEAAQKTYTIEVAGTDGWASASVTPSVVSLAPGASGQVSVFVSPNEDASGLQQFSVYVKDGATIVDTLPLTASVTASSSPLGTIGTIGSIALVGLVALAVLWVWKREAPVRPARRTTARKGKKKDNVYY